MAQVMAAAEDGPPDVEGFEVTQDPFPDMEGGEDDEKQDQS